MGRSTYPVTPPSSTLLEPRPSEMLPEISLGPAHLQHGAGPHKERTTGYPPYTKPPPPTESRPIPRKSKPSRKTTHSQIEKRRREKINDTMQRLKDLVPACHDQDLLLRKLDVLTATADYIEELQTALYGRPMPLSPTSPSKTPNTEISSIDMLDSTSTTRRSSRTADMGTHYAESGHGTSSDDQDVASPVTQHSSSSCNNGRMHIHAASVHGNMEVDDVSAAESLLHISESPALRPVERQRLSISELMCL